MPSTIKCTGERRGDDRRKNRRVKKKGVRQKTLNQKRTRGGGKEIFGGATEKAFNRYFRKRGETNSRQGGKQFN